MAMKPAVSYIPYSISSKEKTGDVTSFTLFEEENLLTENTKIGNEYDDVSTLEPFFSK